MLNTPRATGTDRAPPSAWSRAGPQPPLPATPSTPRRPRRPRWRAVSSHTPALRPHGVTRARPHGDRPSAAGPASAPRKGAEVNNSRACLPPSGTLRRRRLRLPPAARPAPPLPFPARFRRVRGRRRGAGAALGRPADSALWCGAGPCKNSVRVPPPRQMKRWRGGVESPVCFYVKGWLNRRSCVVSC